MPLIQRGSVSDKRHLIPDSLTQSGGIITCVVGASTTTVTPTGLTANTLYFLYLRMVSGTLQLQALTTTPSATRLLFPEAILVGAFYSNGANTVAFGSFVNIDGVPKSDIVQDSNWSIGASGAIPTPASPVYLRRWYRDGARLVHEWSFSCNAGGGGGSGTYFMPTPANLTMDNTKTPAHPAGFPGPTGTIQTAGYGYIVIPGDANSRGSATPIPVGPNQIQLYTRGSSVGDGVFSNSFYQLSVAISFTARIEAWIVGWADTPLKDL